MLLIPTGSPEVGEHRKVFLVLKPHAIERVIGNRPVARTVAVASTCQEWLAGFDRSTADGRRNYAMALCLADLGLRVGDLAALCLDDVNWRNATIRIPNSKTGRSYWLPLPARTGKAIAEYLRRGRPESSRRELFLRHKTPINVPLSSVMIDRRMRQVARQQGIPWFGVHALRHTAATRMRSGGASLKEIADVLGHVNLGSTAIYAKIDLRELAKVALPWPEVQP
jgi:integrase